jgi:hypothetical protein
VSEPSRYIVGIDLGTTHSALAYVDTHGSHPVQLLSVPQLVRPGAGEAKGLLPSFLYLAARGEFPSGALDLPWESGREYAVGELARSHGWQVPSRLISSAKSWLSHGGVDRQAPILPWGEDSSGEAPSELERLSPVVVSARYLDHLRAAWDQAHPDAPLHEQELYLTVPASFDAVARELTLRAAQLARLGHATLLEEPQAAFYAWLGHQGEAWRQQLGVGDRVLVCDVGGGTTDFSLIAVAEEAGNLTLERVAVGEHILLGGDNMDLALAYSVMRRLADRGTKPDGWQQRCLTYSCRMAKEALLADPAKAEHPVTVPGRGSKVIGGSIRETLSQVELGQLLLDGFFPRVGRDSVPRRERRMGLADLGLPYAADAAITRHLAKFLADHGPMPTALLFNGGVMKAGPLRDRLVDVLGSWSRPPRTLPPADLDVAVALGAATYGLARRGKGVRIRGGTARSYYVGIESAAPAVPGLEAPLKALCVAPFGMEEGSETDVGVREFALVVGEPAEFRLLSSTVRPHDPAGLLLNDGEWSTDELQETTPLVTTLAAAVVQGGESDDTQGAAAVPQSVPAVAGSVIPVRLHSKVTEVGTLELWCLACDGSSRRWRLEYNVRERPGSSQPA